MMMTLCLLTVRQERKWHSMVLCCVLCQWSCAVRGNLSMEAGLMCRKTGCEELKDGTQEQNLEWYECGTLPGLCWFLFNLQLVDNSLTLNQVQNSARENHFLHSNLFEATYDYEAIQLTTRNQVRVTSLCHSVPKILTPHRMH